MFIQPFSLNHFSFNGWLSFVILVLSMALLLFLLIRCLVKKQARRKAIRYLILFLAAVLLLMILYRPYSVDCRRDGTITSTPNISVSSTILTEAEQSRLSDLSFADQDELSLLLSDTLVGRHYTWNPPDGLANRDYLEMRIPLSGVPYSRSPNQVTVVLYGDRYPDDRNEPHVPLTESLHGSIEYTYELGSFEFSLKLKILNPEELLTWLEGKGFMDASS
ncbi:hypothetical protein [Anaerolentibacter hominis]|uniref:hypothetical protein n=1 Tax=Anaerolentibacter hominis TaxID=3079009 RepID=UPI0031B85B90